MEKGSKKVVEKNYYGMSQANAISTKQEQGYRGTNKVMSIKLQTFWKEFDNLSMKEDEPFKYFSIMSPT